MIFLGNAVFFTTMGLLTFGVKRSSQFRGKIHNGFWLWKLIALIGILLGMIFAIQKVEEDLFLFWWKNIGLAIGIRDPQSIFSRPSDCFANIIRSVSAVCGETVRGFPIIGSMFVCWQMYVFVKFAATWSKSWYIASEPRYEGDESKAGRRFLWKSLIWFLGLIVNG